MSGERRMFGAPNTLKPSLVALPAPSLAPDGPAHRTPAARLRV